MKIAIISGIFNKKGGVSRYAVETTERVAKKHDVHLITGDYGYKVEGLHVHSFPSLPEPALFRFVSNAIKNEILLKLANKKFNFDLIVNQCSESFTQDIVTAHSCHKAWVEQYNCDKDRSFPRRPADWAILAVEKQNYKKGNYKKIISVSEGVKKEIQRCYNVPEENITVVPNGVDIEEFRPDKTEREKIRNQLKIGENEPVLLFSGYEFHRKGLRYIIEALKMLPGNVKLIVMGKDDPVPYMNLAAKLGIKDRIIFTGFVRKTNSYFAASDIFVFPTSYEPFGLVITEAMACGIPVITSRNAGAAELMTDGYEGLLLNDKGNANEIAQKIRLLIDDEKLQIYMGKNARKKAEKYSWENVARKTLEIYEAVAES